MKMKDFKAKLKANQKREDDRKLWRWYNAQLTELMNYIELGTKEWLRELSWHAIKHLVAEAKSKGIRFKEYAKFQSDGVVVIGGGY